MVPYTIHAQALSRTARSATQCVPAFFLSHHRHLHSWSVWLQMWAVQTGVGCQLYNVCFLRLLTG